MKFETIQVASNARIGTITFNRPDKLNAINRTLMAEVTQALSAFNDDSEILAIVVNGNGRAFSAGFDMKESSERGTPDLAQWGNILKADFDFIMQFWDSPKPTIAAVHGYCLAGAFELALACDVTIAAQGTRFGEPEVRFGSGIIAMLLPWVAGPKAAKELLLTGTDDVDAERALALGIVNNVVESGKQLEEAYRIAGAMAAAAPLSVQMTKRAINRSYDVMGLRSALFEGLNTDILIEATGGPERAEFNHIRKEQGLKAALKWRDERFA
ncbi:enoyl-CoA hydratase/isomerase family protein [Allopusillimonas ginsengisoli]|uniref:enoyl-CoA hydratase/isomerase family protein n=1 Tax=Allopusillimonas ginsengisoli TaxID=453575 RepID=UPI001021433A|nr:enoyl-CoA hydratase/isomerase family protein [Allopusillimonas ginsengisoli]TEA74179.1 enoyl-CoA hydratase/isomerase family protein [Allopusillimonas ginsengisoli]